MPTKADAASAQIQRKAAVIDDIKQRLESADAAVLTVEFKTNLLAPAKGERFLFRAHVVKPGRTLTVCEGRAFALENDAQTGPQERLVATMNGTLMALYDRPDISQ